MSDTPARPVSDWARCPGCDTNMVVIHPLDGSPTRYGPHWRRVPQSTPPRGVARKERCPAAGAEVHPSDIAAAR